VVRAVRGLVYGTRERVPFRVRGRIAGLRLAREKQVNVRVAPTSGAIDESVDLAHEIFNRVFRKTHRRLEER
jgi:hypothetical protein